MKKPDNSKSENLIDIEESIKKESKCNHCWFFYITYLHLTIMISLSTALGTLMFYPKYTNTFLILSNFLISYYLLFIRDPFLIGYNIMFFLILILIELIKYS